jgi:Fe-S cluster assembly scaffold protein SufB
VRWLQEKSLIELCKALGEKEWAKEIRFSALNRLLSSKLPNFSFGSNVVIKPAFNFSSLAIKRSPGFSLNVHSADGLEVIHVKGYSMIGQKTLSEFSGLDAGTWYSHFHNAFVNDIIFVRVPKNLELTTAAIFDIEVSGLPSSVSVYVDAEEGSKSVLVFRKTVRLDGSGEKGKDDADESIHHPISAANYLGLSIKTLTHQGAEMDIVSVQDSSHSIISVEERNALVMRDAKLRWIDIATCAGTSGYAHCSTISELSETGASASVRSLFSVRLSQNMDIFASAVHIAPNTTSDMLTRGIVSDKAKVLTRGLIRIEKNAFSSRGYERQDSLLLGKDAEADAIPSLDIRNHDVKCSHGSTVGQLGADKIYYLMSRGMSETEAKKMIVRGYFSTIIDSLPYFDKLEDELAGLI